MKRLGDFQKHLRLDQTEPEKIFWYHIRGRQIEGLKFRRQVPIGSYIVDFLCLERKLIVELDGDEHADHMERDSKRTEDLEKMGYLVCRYPNRDVMENLEGVIRDILERCNPSP